jgi:L-amino acid N-acyltransferase YncA
MHIRFATIQDTDALLAIYNQYIETDITFEYLLPGQQVFANRIRSIGAFYPYLVAEEDGRIVGYAYASRAFERAAYAWCADLSIYLDKNYRSHGLGRTLYELLFEISKLQGINLVFGVVTGTNAPSVAFHKALGFKVVGNFPHNGYKNHTWLNVFWLAKELLPARDNPAPVKSIMELNQAQLCQLLEQAAAKITTGT